MGLHAAVTVPADGTTRATAIADGRAFPFSNHDDIRERGVRDVAIERMAVTNPGALVGAGER